MQRIFDRRVFRGRLAIMLLVSLCLLLIAVPVVAQPALPYIAWGSLKSGDKTAPGGIRVTAWCGGRASGAQCDAGSTTTTTGIGNYSVQVACAGRTSGERIDFKVIGTNGAAYWANEYGTFDCPSGDQKFENINLTVDPLAVTVVSLGVTRGYNRVFVRWQTGAETDVLGFNIYRGTDVRAMQQGSAVKLNARLIPSRAAGPGQGAAYGYIDRGFDPEASYYYWIESVAGSGARQVHGPVAATLPGASPCAAKGICPVGPRAVGQ